MRNFIAIQLILLTCIQSFAVINGRTADANLSAATVRLTIKNTDGTENCSGVVVDPHLILTAGHCTEGADPNDKMQITNDVNGRKTTTFRTSWKTAKGYTNSDKKSPNDIQYDFAYVKTSNDLVKELGIDPAQIPKVASSLEEMKAALSASGYEAIGYGYGINDSKGHEGVKKELKMRVTLFDDAYVIMGKSLEPSVGLCQGDSGGGIFARAENGRPLLLGNLSGITATKPCGASDSFGSYSYVVKHICWVQQSSQIDLGATCPN